MRKKGAPRITAPIASATRPQMISATPNPFVQLEVACEALDIKSPPSELPKLEADQNGDDEAG